MPIMMRYCLGASKCLTSGGKVNTNGLKSYPSFVSSPFYTIPIPLLLVCIYL